MVAMGYRCVCATGCAAMELVGSRHQFGQGNHPPETVWLPNWGMLLWVLGGQRLGQEHLKGQPLMVTPTTEFPMFVCGGE